ncbi:FGGY family carbohydrate kinase [Phytohabitans sp. ZYX-F-186]|uniref:FGGY family carbohydrate kinase n=1 Tax=Phytohabitans maris TaxID=3071409 RepID=A0ABU0ZQX2_9ACTN|nr:FGGY family carbohydrate kinase [Phytohabitans sp. ZYX-F-186]MDQ7909400.1 FGGY family carbohydrate kinase [Phytohabitans sp. ZYX-F-186]
MTGGLLVGVDLGTTGAKAVVVDPGDGKTVSRGYRAYPSDTTHADRHEQDPADWWSASAGALRDALAEVPSGAVRGVGLSGHTHAVALFDAADRPVRPAMTWADRRAAAEVARLRQHGDLFRERCGNPVVEAFTAPKLAWLAAHEPDALRRAARLVQPKDAVRHHLTGEWHTDVSDAAATLLFDVRRNGWDPELWALCAADTRLAPPVVSGTTVVGEVRAEAARLTGLPAGTPVVAGGCDVACAALGGGAVAPGRVYVNAGTAAQVLTPLPDLRAGDYFVFARAGEPGFLAMVSVYAAGLAIGWCEEHLLGGAAGEPPGRADRLAAGTEPGARGLTFVPHLVGTSTPTHDPRVRAALLGAAPMHGTGDVARAALEGVAYACAAAVDHLARAAGGDVTEVRVGGGVARSPIWRESLAAVLDAPVRRLSQDATPRAAVALAGAGTGVWPDVAAASAALDDTEPVTVPDGHLAAYREAAERYTVAADAMLALARSGAGGRWSERSDAAGERGEPGVAP